MVSQALGRPRKVVLQTFRIYDDEVRVVDRLTGFRRVQTVMVDHLPAVRDGDTIEFDAPSHFLQGEVMVLEHKHISTKKGMKTALAIWLNDQEVESG